MPPGDPSSSSQAAPSDQQSAPLAVPEPQSTALEVEPDEPVAALPAPEGPRTEVMPTNGAPPTSQNVLPDLGLYAVLGLDPSASDAEVQTTYRRQAAKLLGDDGDITKLRRLNSAYEVLGNPARRAEYDRAQRTLPTGQPIMRTPIGSGAKASAAGTRRRRPRYVVQPRYAGFGDVLVVLTVVGLAIVAASLIIPRVSVNLSGLNALSNVLPVSVSSRRAIDATTTPAATRAAPTPTVRPGLADRFAGSTVSVSNASPARNTSQNIVVRLRRDGQPAANLDVFATLQYRTTEERWPASGTVKTDASGAATIPFNVGPATPGFQVQVHVFAQVDDQQLSWSTSFTPR